MKSLQYNNSSIQFGSLSESNFDALLKSDRYAQSKKIIITDENVFDHWMEFMIGSFDGLKDAEIIQLPAGEENKVLEICVHVWNALSEYEIGRNDLIINLGGGVITDMGGFIASTFKRGLSFINIPTTLLSQVDASVGGKTGIDLGPYKNQIGVFSDAEYVFIDSHFLTTLPDIELKSGYAEMLKHGLIADKNYWEALTFIDPIEAPEKLLDTIFLSVSIKHEIVVADHLEKNVRKNLNFGHTIGHAIEGFCLVENKTIPHGYGVAWGMIAEAYISLKLELISQDEFNAINNTLRQFYAPLELTKENIPELKKLLINDKKNSNGMVNFSLLKGIGNAIFDQNVSDALIEEAFSFILNPSK